MRNAQPKLGIFLKLSKRPYQEHAEYPENLRSIYDSHWLTSIRRYLKATTPGFARLSVAVQVAIPGCNKVINDRNVGHRKPEEKDERMRAYEQDFAGWAEDTAKAIEDGRFEEVDRLALADEVASLSRSETRRIESAFRVLLIHLLKVKYQPERHTHSWDLKIQTQRRHIAKYLEESPSLRTKMEDLIASAYQDARYDAEHETGIFMEQFPDTCEWTMLEVLGT